MKKIKTLLLVMMLVLSFSVSANAMTDEEVIKMVGDEEIMQGTDNGFEPEKTLTRAEITAIVVRIKDMENDAISECDFSDVDKDNWAYNYISIATKNGITKGTGNGEFSPSREVTVAEAVTMIVRAVADGESIEKEGTWPDNYMDFARSNNLLADITKTKDDIIQRIDTARIITNVLSSPNWNNEEVTDEAPKPVEEEDEEGKIQVSRVGAGVIVSIATMADDYNAIELATPYGVVELIAHDSELTSGTVLAGTYVDFWLAGTRMWDINAEPVTGITPEHHMAKIVNFSDGVVKLVKRPSASGEEPVDADFISANNIIFLKCEKMNTQALDAGKVLRTFDNLEFGTESDIELADDYKISYNDIDADEIFYQSIMVDDEERIVAIIYEK